MDKALKQRMVGAVVLIALGVIFIPMLLDGGSGEDAERSVELDIPAAPDREYRSRRLPLGESGGQPEESGGEVERSAELEEARPEMPRPARTAPDQGPSPADEDGAGETGNDGEPSGDTAGGESEDGSAPPETEPQPAPREPDAGETADQPLGNWFVQVGSFSRESNAGELRDRLREAGYTAFVESSTVEGKTTHRVRVGPEMDRSSAESQRDEIQSEFDLKGIVISEP